MGKKELIQLFGDKKVRTVWDDEKEKWFFSIPSKKAVPFKQWMAEVAAWRVDQKKDPEETENDE